MKNTWQNIKQYTTLKRTSLSVILIYDVVNIVIAAFFYLLIPTMLNYPPDSINNDFQTQIAGLHYTQQYILIVIMALLAGHLFIVRNLKGIDNWKVLTKQNKNISTEEIQKIRNKCFNNPYSIYAIQVLFPTISVAVILALVNTTIILIVRILTIIFSFVTLAALISHIFSKRIFKQILLNTYNNQEKEGIRIELRNKIFLQMVPMFLVTLLFMAMIGYSRLVKEKGELLFESYNAQLINTFKVQNGTDNLETIKDKLSKISFKNKKDTAFIIFPTGQITTLDSSKLSDFFVKYMKQISPKYNGHIHDYYGSDTQGAYLKVKSKRGEWIVGIRYVVASNETMVFFIVCFIILLGLNMFVLSYFSKTLSEDISLVAKSLTEIAEGGDINNIKKLPVTSNDEIGDLVMAFNKIQDLTRQNIETIQENQAILMERERLASLGQLVGGIAHNLKTPIMSISGGLEGLDDLIKEYDESIEDKEVTPEDHHEIAKEMRDWIVKMKTHCAYMSDIITAVKGQAVQFTASSTEKFTLDELLKRIDILMKHELRKYYCKLNLDSKVDLNTELKGEINSLVQVFNNLITNGIQSYEGKEGTIDICIEKKENMIQFTVRDYGKGIPQDIKNKLFKEMVTTKAKHGTGLGLYMSYSTIKGRFGGSMWFESEEGKGTTFHITVPYISTSAKKGVS